MKEKRIWIPDFRLQKCFVFNLSNMKEVENLLQTPIFRLKIEEKREMKRLGPHHPKEIPIVQILSGSVKDRAFNAYSWSQKILGRQLA